MNHHAYCVRCKKMVNASGHIVQSHNRKMFKGHCPHCKGKVNAFTK